MVNISSRSAAHGLLPLTIGGVQVTELTDLTLTALAPYKGKSDQAVQMLDTKHGLDWPAPNEAKGTGPYVIWFGHAHVLLVGTTPDPAMEKCCAVTDQTDAWTVLEISGAMAADILSRLTPTDLRDGAFPVGATARTEIQHMQGSITRTAPTTYQVMAFRSMAQTLVHDLKTAMEAVAALNA